MTGALWKNLYYTTEKRHNRERFLAFVVHVKEHVSKRIPSDDNPPNEKKAADVEPKGSGSINSMPSKILIQE